MTRILPFHELLLVLRGPEVHPADAMPETRQSTIRELSSVRRVLVVDDQPDCAELIGMLLEEEGHEVKVAHDGESALLLARDFRPQVALLDISLSGMDGHELGRALRASADTAECRLIALSGHCDERARQRSAQAGFETHLSKPVDMALLFNAIRSARVSSVASSVSAVDPR